MAIKISMQFFGGRGGTSGARVDVGQGLSIDRATFNKAVQEKKLEISYMNSQPEIYGGKRTYNVNDVKSSVMSTIGRLGEAKARAEISRRLDVQKKRASEAKVSSSREEKTTREITSLAYKRAQARIKKEIDGRFKGR